MTATFQDRAEAGKKLGAMLSEHYRKADVIVLALPRGGVPVGYEVAKALDAPLDLFLVRKLGVPGHEELAMGAIAADGTRVLNREVISQLGIPGAVIRAVVRREEAELKRRNQFFRNGHSIAELAGRTVILIDDGLATGSTMRAAIAALRLKNPAKIVVAVPVAAPSIFQDISGLVDQVVCLLTPEPFFAVGAWYGDFAQTSDDEVRQLLEAASSRYAQPPQRKE